ncbi:hypothetical protein LXA43DRAFT_298122 [Ganoderma leucocontextum]|nr:hypothetical protein LXA43DRAFT_298122 [Ganoderma leucocontextum]
MYDNFCWSPLALSCYGAYASQRRCAAQRIPHGRGRGYTRNNNDHPGRGEHGAPYMRPLPRRTDWSSTPMLRNEPSRVACDSVPPNHTPQRGSSSRKRKRSGEQGHKKTKRHGHPSLPKPEPVSASPVRQPSPDIAQSEHRQRTRRGRTPESRIQLTSSGSANPNHPVPYDPAYPSLSLPLARIFTEPRPNRDQPMSTSTSNVHEDVAGDALQPSSFPTDLSMKEECPLPGIPPASSSQSETLPSEPMVRPAPPQTQTLVTVSPCTEVPVWDTEGRTATACSAI